MFLDFITIYKKILINQIESQNNKLSPLIKISLKLLEDKFALLPPGDGSTNDEFWYLILRNIYDYLHFNYQERINEITIEQLWGILKYINWFILSWPPKTRRKIYLLPDTLPPEEIIL